MEIFELHQISCIEINGLGIKQYKYPVGKRINKIRGQETDPIKNTDLVTTKKQRSTETEEITAQKK